MKYGVVCAVCILLCLVSPTHAAAAEWAEGTSRNHVEFIDAPPFESDRLPGCTISTRLAHGSSVPLDLCVVERPEYSIAVIVNPLDSPMTVSLRNAFFVRLGSSQQYQAVQSLTPTRIYSSSESAGISLVRAVPNENHSYTYTYYAGFASRLHPSLFKYSSQDPGTPIYIFDSTDPDYLLASSSGAPYKVRADAASNNGRYLLLEIEFYGVARFDTVTRELRMVAAFQPLDGIGRYGISDDGHAGFNVGHIKSAVTYTITTQCGHVGIKQLTHNEACPTVSVSADLMDAIGAISTSPTYVYDLHVVNALEFRIVVTHAGQIWRVTLQAGEGPTHHLEYLALGDSYSSGEGDIERKADGSTYYLAGTEKDGECHISSRSYPFLLKNMWSIEDGQMQSVACSGARLLPDINRGILYYPGQDGQLRGLSDEVIQKRQATALEQFTPAVVPQIEFVKQYQPRLITITAGGNDIGFTDILRYCASTYGVVLPYTCDYAKEGSELQKTLYGSIDAQYHYTKQLVAKLKDVSPHSKIVIIGYPSFIAIGAACGINDGSLNTRERSAINGALVRLNEALKKVAQDTSVSYVDVQDSLYGGRMCEGGEYVTEITTLGTAKIRREYFDEAFHPNALGHAKMANRINESGVYTTEVAPSSSDFSLNPDAILSFLHQIIQGDGVLYMHMSNIARSVFDPQTFEPNTTVKYFAYSEETFLGEFVVKPDGSLEASLDTSKLSPGRHVLVASGQDYSGNPIRYYQFIEVHVSEDDADGDGIKNSDDRCNFIAAWYDERTGEDACIPPSSSGSSDTSTAAKTVLGPRSHTASSLQPLLPHAQADSSPSNTILRRQPGEPLPGLDETLQSTPVQRAAYSQSTHAYLNMLLLAIGGIICGVIIYKKWSATKTQDK